jgi:hypothetical protein
VIFSEQRKFKFDRISLYKTSKNLNRFVNFQLILHLFMFFISKTKMFDLTHISRPRKSHSVQYFSESKLKFCFAVVDVKSGF